MRVAGINFITIDCDPGYAPEWNRWYDLDHIPEFLALPGVVGATRYVATPELEAVRPESPMPDLAPGTARYCTIVQVGPDAEGATAGRAGMADVHNRLMPVPGRMPDWSRISPRFIEGYDLVAAQPGQGVPVHVDALAHLGHCGILAELHRVDQTDRGADGQPRAWLEGTHVAGLVEVPGVMAVLRFVPHGLPPVEAPWQQDSDAEPAVDSLPTSSPLLDLYLLDRDPAELASPLRDRSDATRRNAAGAPPRLFHGTFRVIEPLRYDFLR